MQRNVEHGMFAKLAIERASNQPKGKDRASTSSKHKNRTGSNKHKKKTRSKLDTSCVPGGPTPIQQPRILGNNHVV